MIYDYGLMRVSGDLLGFHGVSMVVNGDLT
jgi:hypothetical protein